jgi:2,3-bisphosphoglycerate-dependent phosphoglycerate mutase
VRRIYVITHPEATHHVENKVGGWYDSELTELGHTQAALLAARIRELIPQDATAELFTSDLRRTVQTARPMADVLGVEPVLLPDLREKSYGVAGGRPQAWLDAHFIPPPTMGERLDHDEGIEGAETRREWVTRVYRAMDVITSSSCEHQVVVTHGGSLSWVIGAWIGLTMEATAFAAFRSARGGITVLGEDDYFHNRTLLDLNDTSHLPV